MRDRVRHALANEDDQRIVRAAISDPTNRLLDFLTSLGTRDALAFGEGTSVPIQMRFNELDAGLIPQRRGRDPGQPGPKVDKGFVSSLIARWRGGAPPAAAAPATIGLHAGYGPRAGAR